MPLSPSDRALGDLLVGRRVITLPQLDEAVDLAETWNVRLGDAMSVAQLDRSAALLRGLAHHFDLPFVDLVHEPPDLRAAGRRPRADIYARRLTMPWRRRDGRMVIATAEPGPETVLFARQRWGAAIDFVVASKFDIVWAVQTAFADALSHRAVFELAERDPQMSARRSSRPAQVIVGYCLLTAFLGRPRHRADRDADRAQRRDERVLSRQLRLQGNSGLGRRRPLGRPRSHDRDRGARAARR